MSVGMIRRGRVDGDPPDSEKPRGKSAYRRKSSRDPGLTPTEQHQKNALMRQFLKLDGPKGNSDAYLNSSIWCDCGKGMNRRAADGVTTVPCFRCAPNAKVAS